ncbi:MAG: sulfatase [Acidobacteria bacterium]|nr:sulfatase [Acidobacteriota bacterium]
MTRYLARGVLVWLTYAVLEHTFASFLRLPASQDAILASWHWKLSTLLCGAYAGIGLVTGGVLGLAFSKPEREPEDACILTLILIFVMNLLASPRPWYSNTSLALAALLAAAILSGRRTGVWAAARNPWVVSLLLLGPLWMSRELLAQASLGARMAGSLALVLAILAGGWLAVRSGLIPVRSTAREGLALLIFALALAGAGGALTAKRRDFRWNRPLPAPKRRPNVVMVVLDTVRADHLPVYGYPRQTAPHLSQFAEDAVLFRRAIATSDVTLSSHGSLFTGLYPSAHGAHYAPGERLLGRPLAPRFKTLAQTLSDAGYFTAAVVANYGYLGPEFGLMRGFQQVNCLVPIREADQARDFYLREGVRRLVIDPLWSDDWELFLEARRAEEINRDAYQALEEVQPTGAPFFLFLNYMDAHIPYVPPAPYSGLFPGLDPAFTYSRFLRAEDEVMSLKRTLSERERLSLVSRYDGAIAYLDAQVGDLLGKLKSLGLYENTLIVVTADHGEALGDRNFLQHGGISVYQDQVHVPMLIKFPGAGRRGVVDATVSQIDVLPTVLDTVGVPVPKSLPGLSLAGRDPRRERFIISESFGSSFWADLHPRFLRLERAIFLGPRKFVRSSTGKREFYRLTEDPAELNNLYRPGLPEAQPLEARLAEWSAIMNRQLKGKPAPVDPEQEAETLERLKSLGYVQ